MVFSIFRISPGTLRSVAIRPLNSIRWSRLSVGSDSLAAVTTTPFKMEERPKLSLFHTTRYLICSCNIATFIYSLTLPCRCYKDAILNDCLALFSLSNSKELLIFLRCTPARVLPTPPSVPITWSWSPVSSAAADWGRDTIMTMQSSISLYSLSY